MMELLRKSFDAFYDAIKPAVFLATQHDPEIAHTLFKSFCRFLHATKLERVVLDNHSNKQNPEFKISNAAGFNKNGEIHPNVMKYFGFDGIVIGTVTGEPWEGNPRPRTKRFPKTKSLVNWMGLPGEGVNRIAERIYRYGEHDMPLTINLMATPGKQGDKALRDLERTVLTTKELPNIQGYELNISCPNTHTDGKIDSRRYYEQEAKTMIHTVSRLLSPEQSLDLKVSPDLTEEGVEHTIEIAGTKVKRIVTTNTTTEHLPEYIPKSPGKGGASGDAVYRASLKTQKRFYHEIQRRGLPLELVACGGIDSSMRVRQRIAAGAKEIQIYTPIIFKGTKLLREFRNAVRRREYWKAKREIK